MTQLLLPKDVTLRNNALITRLLKQWDKRNLLESDTTKGLLNKDPKTAQLYLLPKIHKKDVPGRPIIAAIGSPTERISSFVDHNIKLLAQQQPSYLKDTKEFLNRIKNLQVQDDTYIITADVSSLYTNIPHNEGIEACKHFLKERPHASVPTNVLLHMIHIILTHNNFQFNGINYLQINGTAMGTKMAPNYANLFMAKLEQDLLEKAPNNLRPTIWWRYIDDIFFLWDHGKTTLDTFMGHMNQHHHSIKYTIEPSIKEGVFLDTEIYKENNRLLTKVHHKPTDAFAYLHYTSCHPKHVMRNIPKGQFMRYRRICSKTEDYITQGHNLISKLRDRGYPLNLINTAYEQVLAMDREELLKDKKKENNNNCVIYTTQYEPSNQGLFQHIKRYRTTLETSTNKDYFNNLKFTAAYRRARSLRDTLVRSKFNINNPPIFIRGSHPCDNPCASCPYMTGNVSITSSSSGEIFNIQGSYNCQSKNIIYVLTCNNCNIQYVGQTSNSLNTRLRGHIYDIRHNNHAKPVSNHFNNGRCDVDDLNVTIVERVTSRDVNVLLRSEESWIRHLQSAVPSGLNIMQ